MATQTKDRSIRYPDVSVFCGRAGSWDDRKKALDDPRILVEVLSAGTARTGLNTKLVEYQALSNMDTIVFVDTATERVRIVQRTGPGGWTQQQYTDPVDVPLPALDLVIPHAEIFARD